MEQLLILVCSMYFHASVEFLDHSSKLPPAQGLDIPFPTSYYDLGGSEGVALRELPLLAYALSAAAGLTIFMPISVPLASRRLPHGAPFARRNELGIDQLMAQIHYFFPICKVHFRPLMSFS